MTITWSLQQQSAIDKARRWLDAPIGSVPQVHKIFGYAGTGKSELARAINEHIGNRALAAAFTGKAASVQRRKGLLNATTVHRLIYQPVGNDLEGKFRELKKELDTLERAPEPDRIARQRMEALRRQIRSIEDDAKQPKFILKEESDLSGAPLLILDEVSQIDEFMGKDLESFGVKILVLGDPGQLPPIRGTGYYTDQQPDSLLTEIHRQAADNPILRLATMAREGKRIQPGEWASDSGSARVVSRIGAQEALTADMVLCGTNNKRRAINRRHRELNGHATPMPEAGERLCCLRNNHELGLQNGTLWSVVEADRHWTKDETTVYLRIQPEEGGLDLGVPCEASLFENDDNKPAWSNNEFFTWGDCLTVHKSQGSQWDKVILFDDWPSNRSYREWLYTGITRAAEQLTIVI